MGRRQAGSVMLWETKCLQQFFIIIYILLLLLWKNSFIHSFILILFFLQKLFRAYPRIEKVLDFGLSYMHFVF